MPEFQSSPGWLPPGRRIYAVGDVHGCLPALRAIHAAIAADLERRPVDRPLLLHVGDYIDRGPDSAGVIEHLLDRDALPVPEVVNLRGNHEDMFLRGVDGQVEMSESWAEAWIENGGAETLRSWGLGRPEGEPDTWPEQWRAAIPERHLDWLRELRLHATAGNYWFCHAGVRPDRPFDEQAPHDLMWIREPFLSWSTPLERVVVHGHTPRDVVQLLPHRIGIDTGAAYGNRLSCAVLEADRAGFLSVPGGG